MPACFQNSLDLLRDHFSRASHGANEDGETQRHEFMLRPSVFATSNPRITPAPASIELYG
jgi:hypothetical protein